MCTINGGDEVERVSGIECPGFKGLDGTSIVCRVPDWPIEVKRLTKDMVTTTIHMNLYCRHPTRWRGCLNMQMIAAIGPTPRKEGDENALPIL